MIKRLGKVLWEPATIILGPPIAILILIPLLIVLSIVIWFWSRGHYIATGEDISEYVGF